MSKLLGKLRLEFMFNKYSFINSLKATLACVIGLLLARGFNLAQPQWILISILIVMAAQYRLGGAIIKGYLRLLATAIGAALAAAILFLFSDYPFAIHIILFVCISILIYFATHSQENSYAYTLGAVTMVVIVITSNPALKNALDRLIEIMLGVVIAILVSRFVFPIHARKILNENIAATLQFLTKIYNYSIREEKTFNLTSEGSGLEEDIIQKLAAQPVLLKEACAESIQFNKNKFKFTIFLRLERRLLRTIYLLHLTLRLSLRKFSQIIMMPEFKTLHTQVITTLDEISHKVLNQRYVMTDIDLNVTYETIVIKIRSIFDQYSFEDKNKIHTFIFCLGNVITLLTRMKKMIIEISDQA